MSAAAPVALQSAVEQTTQMSSSTYSHMQQMSRFEATQHVESDMWTMAEHAAMGQSNMLNTHQRGSTHQAFIQQYNQQSGMAALYGDIALPEGFLMEYFSQVRGIDGEHQCQMVAGLTAMYTYVGYW